MFYDFLLIIFNSVIFLLGMQVVVEFWNYTCYWFSNPSIWLGIVTISKIGELSIERSFVAVLPYLFVIMVVLLLVAFPPYIALFIPNLFN